MRPGRWRPWTLAAGGVLIAWLPVATSPAIVLISRPLRVRPATMAASACISLSCAGALPKLDGQVAVRDLLGGFSDIVHGVDQHVQVVLDGVEIAVVGVGDLGRHVALADPVHVIRRRRSAARSPHPGSD